MEVDNPEGPDCTPVVEPPSPLEQEDSWGRSWIRRQRWKESLEESERLHEEHGMYLRDRFALAALPMVMFGNADDAGKEAYRFADAAMKARGG